MTHYNLSRWRPIPAPEIPNVWVVRNESGDPAPKPNTFMEIDPKPSIVSLAYRKAAQRADDLNRAEQYERIGVKDPRL
jgi:hypothetical protein